MRKMMRSKKISNRSRSRIRMLSIPDVLEKSIRYEKNQLI
jgi:hypothetical protein